MSAKNRDYDPMSEDGYDSKIPLHNDEAFQHGIQFTTKVKKIINLFFVVILLNYIFSLSVHSMYPNQAVEWKSWLQCVVFGYVELIVRQKKNSFEFLFLFSTNSKLKP